MDRDGNPLPEGAIARLGTLNFRGCGDPILFTPRGKYFVSTAGPSRSQVAFFNPETGKRLFELSTAGTGCYLRFSPDGKRMVCPVRGSYHNPVWDVDTRKQLFMFEGSQAAFSDDGSHLITVSFYDKGHCRILDPATGRVLNDFALEADVSWAEIVPKDTIVVFYDKATGRVVQFDWAHKTRKPSFPCEDGFGGTASPDGKLLAMANRKGVRLVELATDKELVNWKQRADGLVVFSPDGRRLAWSGYDENKGIAYPWAVELGQDQPRRVGLPTNNFAPPCFTPDNKALVVLEDGGIPVWRDVETGNEFRIREAHSGRVLEIVPSADGHHLFSRDFNHWLVWDLRTAKLESRHTGEWPFSFQSDVKKFNSGQADRLKFLSEKKLVDNEGRIIDQNWNKSVFDIVPTPDGHFLAIYYSDAPPGNKGTGRLGLWDLSTGKPLTHLQLQPGNFRFSPDCRLLATTTLEGTLDLWEIATGQKRLSLKGHLAGEIPALTFLSKGRMLASGGSDGQIMLWDLSQRAPDGVWQKFRHTPDRLKSLWDALALADASQANRAIWELIADPGGSVPFLAQRLQPVKAPAVKEVAQLIDDLNSATFVIRQRAMKELAKRGETVLPDIRAALKNPNSLEQARRLQTILVDLDRPELTGERLREVRAVEVLEGIDSNGSREILNNLAKGFEKGRLTQEAKWALNR